GGDRAGGAVSPWPRTTPQASRILGAATRSARARAAAERAAARGGWIGSRPRERRRVREGAEFRARDPHHARGAEGVAAAATGIMGREPKVGLARRRRAAAGGVCRPRWRGPFD